MKIPIFPDWMSEIAPTSNMALTLVVPFGTKDIVSKAPNTRFVVIRPVLDIRKFFKVQQVLFSRMRYLNISMVCVCVWICMCMGRERFPDQAKCRVKL